MRFQANCNLRLLQHHACHASMTIYYKQDICAWGNHGTWQKQELYTLELLKNHNHLHSLGITRGCPRHPLYLRSTIKPEVSKPKI